jgi:hypothetical protein
MLEGGGTMDPSDRPAPRRILQRDVELRTGPSGLRLFGECQNLSETGMLVVAEDGRPPGTRLQFLCHDFQGYAEVVWRQESEEGVLLGLRFLHLDPRDQAVLARKLKYAARY